MFTPLLLCLCCAGLAYAQMVNLTVDDLHQSVAFGPPNAWVWSNEGVGTFGGTFSFSNQPDAVCVFTFPVPATAVYWRGFKRNGGGAYSVCLDCSPNDISGFLIVDGHSDDPSITNNVMTLFGLAGLSNARHTLVIKNGEDPRFRNASQITVDSFILTTSGNIPIPPPTTTLVGSSVSTAKANASVSVSGLSTATVIGVIVGLVVLFALVLLAMFFWWRRRLQMVYSRLNFVDETGSSRDRDGDHDAVPLSPMMQTLRLERSPTVTLIGSDSGKASAVNSDAFQYPGNKGESRTSPFSPTVPTSGADYEHTNGSNMASNKQTANLMERREPPSKEPPQLLPLSIEVPTAALSQSKDAKAAPGRDPVNSLYSLYATHSMYGKPTAIEEAPPEVPPLPEYVSQNRAPQPGSVPVQPEAFSKPPMGARPMPLMPRKRLPGLPATPAPPAPALLARQGTVTTAVSDDTLIFTPSDLLYDLARLANDNHDDRPQSAQVAWDPRPDSAVLAALNTPGPGVNDGPRRNSDTNPDQWEIIQPLPQTSSSTSAPQVNVVAPRSHPNLNETKSAPSTQTPVRVAPMPTTTAPQINVVAPRSDPNLNETEFASSTQTPVRDPSMPTTMAPRVNVISSRTRPNLNDTESAPSTQASVRGPPAISGQASPMLFPNSKSKHSSLSSGRSTPTFF